MWLIILFGSLVAYGLLALIFYGARDFHHDRDGFWHVEGHDR